jgi:hypothetical protein
MEGISEDILTQPLLDGGQGKKNSVLPSVLTKPQGDVKADGSTAKLQTKLQPIQTNWAGGQCPGKANINNLQPYDLITDRGQQVPTKTQQPITMDAWTTNRKGAPTNIDGLLQPIIEATGNLVAGKDIKKLHLQNKWRQHALQEQQKTTLTAWTAHQGTTVLQPAVPLPERWRGEMCPSGIAPYHPAGDLLKDWASFGCLAKTGHPWTKAEMWEAIKRSPHRLALLEAVLEHFAAEAIEKINAGQARIVEWESIKDNPPAQLKISPITAIPHMSRGLRSILDLSFSLRLKNCGILLSVNNTTTKMAPKGALDQPDHALSRIIHAFAETNDTNGAKIFMAKWDVKDGFWCMCCEDGEEWNFMYVLPQCPGAPIRLMVPTSLQMGWVESPAIFLRGVRNSTRYCHGLRQHTSELPTNT